MKPLLPVLGFILFTLFAFDGAAQKQLSEGLLQYNISIVSPKSETPSLNSLNGAVLSVYLKPNLSRTEMKSTLGTESTVYDNRAGSGFILKEYSGQKLMISMNSANWDQKNRTYEDLSFTITGETATIAGYQCKKATATLADGKAFIVYFDPSVVISNKKYNNAFSRLPGLPVQYEIQSGNLSFKYTLSSLSYEAIPASKFEAPKTGFRVMTYEENQQLKKG
ncbi:MAG: hypothetical protein EOO06_06320 [Chitinophagaceae bacterium]|nr:MAG: hypothetical protein EOO06_06320 [Chitinophagaceae bacterium]